jgi:peptidoglycan hydrolase-like protein with peptidoglycan-binding domain
MFHRIAIALFVALLPITLRADETVLATQKKLAQLGFYKGGADGQMGSQTSAAIRRYQIAENLKVTGELNRQTLEQLGINHISDLAPHKSLQNARWIFARSL